MRKKKIIKAIEAYCEENDHPDTAYFTSEGYEYAIIGMSDDGRVIYDYSKMVSGLAASYAKADGGSEVSEDNMTDAIEWIEYNTMGALPYMGDKAPIIMIIGRKELLERYGK